MYGERNTSSINHKTAFIFPLAIRELMTGDTRPNSHDQITSKINTDSNRDYSRVLSMDDDAALREAIQLSLQTDQKKGGINVVDLTADDELWPGFADSDDMDFYKTIAISMGEGSSH